MCKRICALLALILTLMINAGCSPAVQLGDQDAQIYQKIHHKFAALQSYTAVVRLSVVSNKTEQTYELLQQVKEPDMAKIEVKSPEDFAGMTTIYCGETVSVLRDAVDMPLSVVALEELNDVFITDFFARYYQSEETAISVSVGEGTNPTILLETVVCPADAQRYKITLLLDAKKLEPKVLAVYDVGGNIRLKAEFLEFCYNPNLEDSIFST